MGVLKVPAPSNEASGNVQAKRPAHETQGGARQGERAGN